MPDPATNPETPSTDPQTDGATDNQTTDTPKEPEGNPTSPAPTETAQASTEPPKYASLLGEDGEGDVDGTDDGMATSASLAPESYEAFEVEGQTFSEEAVQGFADTAKELGLSQENAQKMFSAMVPTARDYLMKDLAAKSNEWAEATKNDPEVGGANFEANKSVAAQAYKRYATPELRAILNGSGLGAHPEVVRLFYRIGKTMQQDKGVTGGASAPAVKRSRYPKSHMVADE